MGGGATFATMNELIWVVYSERQPPLDRLDCALPHTIGNMDVK